MVLLSCASVTDERVAEWARGVAPAAEPALATAAAAAAAAVGPAGRPWSLWDSGEWWMLLAAQSMAVGTVRLPVP